MGLFGKYGDPKESKAPVNRNRYMNPGFRYDLEIECLKEHTGQVDKKPNAVHDFTIIETNDPAFKAGDRVGWTLKLDPGDPTKYRAKEGLILEFLHRATGISKEELTAKPKLPDGKEDPNGLSLMEQAYTAENSMAGVRVRALTTGKQSPGYTTPLLMISWLKL